MTKQDDQKPEAGAVLKTGGEDSASAYVASEVPAGKDCPTIEVARVKIVPPSQTPTVKLADLAKRPGPRAPDQMVLPKPTQGPVELPDGRPLTKMQRLEIDSDFSIELAQRREALSADQAAGVEAAEAGAAEVGAAPGEAVEPAAGRMESPWVKEAAVRVVTEELPSANGPPSAPVSTAAGKAPGKRGLALAILIGVSVAIAVIAALRPGRGRAVDAVPAVRPSATVTVVPNATASTAATVTPSATAAPPPSTAASATVTPSAALPQASRPHSKRLDSLTDPYGEAGVRPLPATTAAPTAEPTVTPTATQAPVAPKVPATSSSAHPAPSLPSGPILGEKE